MSKLPVNLDELKLLSELPAVATACGAVASCLMGLLPGYEFVEVPDGGLVARPRGTAVEAVRLLFVTHVDEVGGFVLFPEEGGFGARHWGNRAAVFADTPLQAFRYDARDVSGVIPCRGRATEDGRLILEGAGLEPFTMLWTFQEPFRIEGDLLTGKALDPRATVYCAVEAARRLQRPDAALLFCYAEECSITATGKLVEYVRRHMPAVETVVNADVPALHNLAGVEPEEVAIRPMERDRLTDPTFSLNLYKRLRARSVEVKLGVAATGSQTHMFVPLARTVSVALPAQGIHQARATLSRTALERCARLLLAIGEMS